MLRPAGKRGAIVLLAAVLGVALTANLGFWQLRRAAQKIALQTALDSRALLPVLGPADVLGAADVLAGGEAAEALHYRRVRLQGAWVRGQTVFLENRQMEGRVGFYVVTPLRLSDRPDVIIVQRGWVPRDQRDRSLLPQVPTPLGQIVVTGTIAPPPARLYEFAPSASGVIRQNLDLPVYAREIDAHESGLRLLPISVQQADDPSQSSAGDGLLRRWPRPALNVDMHYGYALQWFALCALMAGLYVWFQLLRPWRRRRRSGCAACRA